MFSGCFLNLHVVNLTVIPMSFHSCVFPPRSRSPDVACVYIRRLSLIDIVRAPSPAALPLIPLAQLGRPAGRVPCPCCSRCRLRIARDDPRTETPPVVFTSVRLRMCGVCACVCMRVCVYVCMCMFVCFYDCVRVSYTSVCLEGTPPCA